MIEKPKNKVVISCGSLKAELEKLEPKAHGIRVCYMPHNLHRLPDKMREMLQEKINEFDTRDNQIVLGYGLCSNGVAGLKAPVNGFYVPRVHDCIALYLGSLERYHRFFRERPGTYYLTKNWIENQKDPLGLLENEYTRRVGVEMARETIERELKNYSYICYINTGDKNENKLRERAIENAKALGKEFIEVEGDNLYFRKILFGPYEKKDFVYIEPNQISNYKNFFKKEN